MDLCFELSVLGSQLLHLLSQLLVVLVLVQLLLKAEETWTHIVTFRSLLFIRVNLTRNISLFVLPEAVRVTMSQ